jgi:hypothetical protein
VTAGYLTSYWVEIGGERALVRPSEGDEDGCFTLVLGARRIPVDVLADLLAAVIPGERVVADFGSFAIALRAGDDGKPRYQALSRRNAEPVAGPVETDEELACWGLLAVLGDDRAPRACFFCRWSDVEPSTGWGHLGCAVDGAETYHAIATSPDPRRRKWGPQAMLRWVDEWHACERFEVRPLGYGYRGRPR